MVPRNDNDDFHFAEITELRLQIGKPLLRYKDIPGESPPQQSELTMEYLCRVITNKIEL